MIEKHIFDPACPGCRPALMDPMTGKTLPEDHPVMKAANKVWDSSPREMQEALNRIWVHNSREPADLAYIDTFVEQLHAEGSN